MTQEEKFKEAKRLYQTANADQKYVLERLFPELKESEAERIRKEILEYFQQFENEELRGVNISDWIVWLERQAKQKSAWGEEDEEMLSDIDGCVKNLPIFYETIKINGEEKTTKQFVYCARNWLKSLKNRVLWKPSDEQMLAINTAINAVGKGTLTGKYLIELHEQLKKLREE